MTDLTGPISDIRGIGPKKRKSLEKLEVFTVEDLLYYFPRNYEDRRNKVKISQLDEGVPSVVIAEVISKESPKGYRNKKSPFKLYVKDETGVLELVFFQAAYLDNIFKIGKRFIFFGTPIVNFNKFQMIHPDFSPEEEGEGPAILPIYPLTEGLGQREIRKWQKEIIGLADGIKEYLPESTLKRNNLCGISYALNNIHFPEDKKKYLEARYRLVFEELLELNLGLGMMKNGESAEEAGIEFDKNIDIAPFLDNLGFELTGAQKRVIESIFSDMESSGAMNRLIQGDVGSGKTVVAAAAMYKAVKSGFQAVMMAPTEILASQHYDEIQRLLGALGIKTGFLSGNIKKSERNKILEGLRAGDIDIMIGTHALLQDDVIYKNLGLAITDEQHRFGVRQRVMLSQKGEKSDVLVMTATPIPRTLAFILYGDLDISVIDEMPPGRQEITTKYFNGKDRNTVYEFAARELKKGRQVYVVAPLIEDSEVMDQIKSAETLYNELTKRFKEYKPELLHGGMTQAQKDQIMEDFYKGDVGLLVSTVVIEVGINVKNATVMIVENAERFGLAQLHQLRGRVGRGEHKSYCLLISDSKTEEARERLELMANTSDGFEISEKDLQMRGPGDLFGSRQHGLPKLKLSDLIKHVDIFDIIKRESAILIESDPKLSNEENSLLKARIEKMFQTVGEIGL